MSLLNGFLQGSISQNTQNFNLGNNLAFQNFLRNLNTNNPKQSVIDLIKSNHYSKEQITQIKQMAKQFGFSEAQINQLDKFIS